jgi:hypothetical protein
VLLYSGESNIHSHYPEENCRKKIDMSTQVEKMSGSKWGAKKKKTFELSLCLWYPSPLLQALALLLPCKLSYQHPLPQSEPQYSPNKKQSTFKINWRKTLI